MDSRREPQQPGCLAKSRTLAGPSTENQSVFSLWRPSLPYIIPFAIYAVFTYIPALFTVSKGIVYPVQVTLVAVSLLYFWKDFREEIAFRFSWLAVVSGIFVFLVWILPEGLYPQLGSSEFNPYAYADGNSVYLLIAFRLAGASLVVPVMEELFWRSFALRYIIHSDFKSIPLGRFSWFSFLLISLLFGLEHHRWLVGIIAGIVYAGLLCRSKNLFVPILSHAVTNLLLGVYVLYTEQYSFW